MYEELVKSLRKCAAASCGSCKYDLAQYGCRGMLQNEAADAIEELQKAVLRLEEASGILDELPMVDQRESPEEET